MTDFDAERIKKAVSERYSERARKAAAAAEGKETLRLTMLGPTADACTDEACCAVPSSEASEQTPLTVIAPEGESCCGPSELASDEASFLKGIYSQTEVEGLPAGALEAAAGCGNPIAIAEMRPGETVVDLGSGGGIDCLLAAKQVGAAGRVIGVDMTPDMIALARKNAEKVGATNVSFKLGEIEDLPLANESADVIISNCVINLSPDKAGVFREAYRVLRPGGRLRVSDMVWLDAKPEDAGTLESWAGCIAGALLLDEYLGGLREAGFTNARAEPRRIAEGVNLASALVFAEKPGA